MEGLNVGTVPTFKMHNVGTDPTFKMHNVVTVPKFKMYNVGTVPKNKMHNIGIELSYATLRTKNKIKMTFDGRQPLTEEDLRRKMTFNRVTVYYLKKKNYDSSP